MKISSITGVLLISGSFLLQKQANSQTSTIMKERVNINSGWRFMPYTSEPDKLIYDVRPEVTDRNDNVEADSRPTEGVAGI